MRWLVDEGIPKYLVDWLRERGDDVLDVAVSAHRSQSDSFLCRLAGREQRVVITRDLGFLGTGLSASPRGVILLRVPHHWRAADIARLVQDSLRRMECEDLVGYVTVIEPGRVRQRRLQDLPRRNEATDRT